MLTNQSEPEHHVEHDANSVGHCYVDILLKSLNKRTDRKSIFHRNLMVKSKGKNRKPVTLSVTFSPFLTNHNSCRHAVWQP